MVFGRLIFFMDSILGKFQAFISFVARITNKITFSLFGGMVACSLFMVDNR